VGQTSKEEAFRLDQSEGQRLIIDGFDANVGESSAFVKLIINANDNAIDQVFKSGRGIEHVLEASDEVVRFHIRIFALIGVVPGRTITNVEGDRLLVSAPRPSIR
jgi:hypothetical protein